MFQRDYKGLDKKTFTDLWGCKINWTIEEDGWDNEKQRLLIDMKGYMLKQSYNMPMYSV